MVVVSDPDNKVLYLDTDDTAQLVLDAIVATSVYNAVGPPRSSSLGVKAGTAVAGLAVANWLYNSLLHDVVETIQHPAQAIGEALTGKGGLPQDMLTAGVGYGAYKGSKAAYQYMRPQGAVAAPTETVEASTAAAGEESVLDVVEGAVKSVPEVLGEIVPEGVLEFAPLILAA